MTRLSNTARVCHQAQRAELSTARCVNMSADASHLAALLPSFTILEATYKTVSAHAVETQVWLPKGDTLSADERARPRPVALYFHGGSFIGGSRHSYEWLPVWQIELMRERGAIVSGARMSLCAVR
jgi:acetyl esterase/lipase